REPERLLAEPGERGRPHALEIAAEGSERQVAVENAVLADLALDLERARDLPQLDGERPLGPRLDEPRDLHGQGRAAADHVAAREPLRAGADQRADIDAAMAIEAPVLVSDEHGQIARIDLVRGRRQTPTAVGQSERPEQAPVAIDDDRRAVARGCEIERPEARLVAAPADARRQARGEKERRGGESEDDRAREA